MNRYKGIWYKYFPNRFNFGISGDRVENVLWRALNLPDKSYLTNIIILRGTNNICIDSPYDIPQMFNRYWCLFSKQHCVSQSWNLQRRISAAYFNADVNNVRQRRNSVAPFNVEFSNVRQRGNNFVKMTISKNKQKNHFKSIH